VLTLELQVVKVHYILSMATYNAAQSYAHRAQAASKPAATPVAVSETASANGTTGSASSSSEGQEQGQDSTPALPADGAADPTAMAVESSGSTGTDATTSAATSASVPASTSAVTPAAASQREETPVDVFSGPHDALASFNLFLPVLVAQ
jgi:hypothetical protein